MVRKHQGLWEELDMRLVVTLVDREEVEMVAMSLDLLKDTLDADQRD